MKKLLKLITICSLAVIMCISFVGCTLSQEQLLKKISNETSLIKQATTDIKTKSTEVGNLTPAKSNVNGNDYSVTSDEIAEGIKEFAAATIKLGLETATLAVNASAYGLYDISVNLQISYIKTNAKELSEADLKTINEEYVKLTAARKELSNLPKSIESSYNKIKDYFSELDYKQHITIIVPAYKEIVKNMETANTQLDICVKSLGKISTILITYGV